MLLCVLVAHDGITAALLLSALLKGNASLRSHEVYISQVIVRVGTSTVRG